MPELPPSPKPLLILFANLKGNLGDTAILEAMLVALERRYPGREAHIYSMGELPVDRDQLSRWEGESPVPFVYKGKSPYRRVRHHPGWVRLLGMEKRHAARLVGRLSREFATLEPIAGADRYEAVFLAGGGQWGGHSHGINMLAILDAVATVNPAVFMFPFSVKPDFLAGYPDRFLRRIFSRIAADLVVRDSVSAEIMRRVRPDVVTGTDSVFALMGAGLPVPPPPPGEPVVMVAVTLVPGSPGGALRDAVARLVAAGIKVRLFTTCVSEDGEGLSRLAEELGAGYLAPASWHEMVDELGSAALVVTNRLHCIVFSFFAKVPVIPLVNRGKVAGIVRDLGLSRSITDLAELDPARVGGWLAQATEIRREMNRFEAGIPELSTVPWRRAAKHQGSSGKGNERVGAAGR